MAAIQVKQPPSERIIHRLAAERGCDPLDLDIKLYDIVDPDALDDLVASVDEPVTIEFPIDDDLVAVWHDGDVTIE